MKKYVLIGILVICGVGSLGYYFVMNRESETNKTETSQSKEQTIDTAMASNDDSKSTSKSETKKEKQTTDDSDAIYLVRQFAGKFTNFSDVYERNQAIKPFVTDKFAKDNTLDVDPNVEYRSIGTIESVSQDVSNNKLFVVVGKEESKGYSNDFCLQIELNSDRTKVADYVMQYVRGY